MLIPDAPAMGDMSEGMPTIPEATYNLRVHKSEYVAVPKTKDAKGPYIKAQLVVTGPGQDNKFIGRMVFMNYSITGDGSFRLRELLTVTGHPADFRLTDSDQLIGLEFAALVTIQAGTDGYPDKNQVKRHMPLLGAQVAQPATA